MKLLTKEIEASLPPLYSQEHVADPLVRVKFFDPCGSWTWYATEGERQEDGDVLFFGLVDGFEKELGYFTLRELESVKGPLGLGIERDLYFKPVPLSLVGKGDGEERAATGARLLSLVTKGVGGPT